jgi:hypothetical protein
LKGEKKETDKKRTNVLTLLLVLGLTITTFPIVTQKTQAAPAASDPTFSIMQISDTQHLAFLNPTLYSDTTSWIVNNSASYNLQMVVHTGDFIDAFSPTFALYDASQLAQEMTVANASMSKLLNAGIPYCWDAGNHDQTPWGNPDGTAVGSGYLALNATYMHSKPYWVGDLFDSKNTAVKFTYNGYLFLIINLEYRANSSAIAWMRSLLNANPTANVIIATHAYLNAEGGYGSTNPLIGDAEIVWTQAFKETINSYPNIFLALSGHISGAATTRVGNRQEILFCPQDVNSQLGSASVRIYSFNLTSKTVNASTYSVDTKTWRTDTNNQFSFSTGTLAIPEFAGPMELYLAMAVLVTLAGALLLRRKTTPLQNQSSPELE